MGIEHSQRTDAMSYLLRARVKEPNLSLFRDVLVMGKSSVIGSAAVWKAITLLVPTSFDQIDLTDDVIGSVLVRKSLLRRIPRQKLVDFVLERIKPLMGEEEILQVDLRAEVLLREEELR
jgi:hypothetical protein